MAYSFYTIIWTLSIFIRFPVLRAFVHEQNSPTNKEFNR